MQFDIFPTLEHEIRLSHPERVVTLIAACEMNQVGRFNIRESAAHSTRFASNSSLNRQDRWIFTSSVVRAQTDSRDRAMVFVAIKKKYLTKVPNSLNGWSCPYGTPMQVMKIQHGRPSSGLSFLNA